MRERWALRLWAEREHGRQTEWDLTECCGVEERERGTKAVSIGLASTLPEACSEKLVTWEKQFEERCEMSVLRGVVEQVTGCREG